MVDGAQLGGGGRGASTAGASTSSDVSVVLTALSEQVACYRTLARLAELQHEHVLNDHTEGLLDVLREREAVLDRAAELERTVGPVKREWAEVSRGLSGETRRAFESLFAETRSLLAQITAGDERDALAMQQRKLRIGEELRATVAARSVHRSYAAGAYTRSQPRQLDEQR